MQVLYSFVMGLILIIANRDEALVGAWTGVLGLFGGVLLLILGALDLWWARRHCR